MIRVLFVFVGRVVCASFNKGCAEFHTDLAEPGEGGRFFAAAKPPPTGEGERKGYSRGCEEDDRGESESRQEGKRFGGCEMEGRRAADRLE